MNDPEAQHQAPDEPPEAGGPPDEPLSRRRLVVGGLAGIAAVGVSMSSFGRAASAAVAVQPQSKQVVVTDPALCVGCLACEVNCSTWHASVGRSALPRIRVTQTAQITLRKEVASVLPSRGGFTVSTCRQCPTPWCLPNCPTDALRVDPATGNRYINEDSCIACGKCEVDCPVEWTGTLARKAQAISSKRVVYDAATNVYAKCDLCIGREGGPICVERCPVNVAIRAGYVKSDHLALELKPSTEEQWKRLV